MDLIIDIKKRLTPRQFQILSLIDIHDQSFTSASDIMGLSHQRVRQIYYKSHRIIKNSTIRKHYQKTLK